MAFVAADERRAIRARRPGLLDYFDAANEDDHGRLPHESGYVGRIERELAAQAVAEPAAAPPVIADVELEAQMAQFFGRFGFAPRAIAVR